MSKDQALGALILLGSIGVLVLYAYMIITPALEIWVYRIVATVAVFGVMGIVAWIGWTMATTPPPAPIESLDELKTSSESSSEEKKSEG